MISFSRVNDKVCNLISFALLITIPYCFFISVFDEYSFSGFKKAFTKLNTPLISRSYTK